MTSLTINTLEIISLKLLRTYLTSIRMLDQWNNHTPRIISLKLLRTYLTSIRMLDQWNNHTPRIIDETIIHLGSLIKQPYT